MWAAEIFRSKWFSYFWSFFQGPQKLKYGKAGFSDNVITAKDIIIATGSVPFVPKGIEVDGKFSPLFRNAPELLVKCHEVQSNWLNECLSVQLD